MVMLWRRWWWWWWWSRADVPTTPPSLVPEMDSKDNLTAQHQQLLQSLENNVMANADPGVLTKNLNELHTTCRFVTFFYLVYRWSIDITATYTMKSSSSLTNNISTSIPWTRSWQWGMPIITCNTSTSWPWPSAAYCRHHHHDHHHGLTHDHTYWNLTWSLLTHQTENDSLSPTKKSIILWTLNCKWNWHTSHWTTVMLAPSQTKTTKTVVFGR